MTLVHSTSVPKRTQRRTPGGGVIDCLTVSRPSARAPLFCTSVVSVPASLSRSRSSHLLPASSGPVKWTPLSRQKTSDPSLHLVRPSWPWHIYGLTRRAACSCLAGDAAVHRCRRAKRRRALRARNPPRDRPADGPPMGCLPL